MRGDPASTGVAPPRRGPGELALRVASAAVLAPMAVLTAWLGSWPFILVWALAAAAVVWEWTGLVADPARNPVVGAVVSALTFAGYFLETGRPVAALLALAAGAVVAAALSPSGKRLWAAAGAAYAGALLAAPAVLRQDPDDGFLAIIFLFAVVWMTDILAYFVGRFVGGPKLWPAISPKKTWSGAIGGALGALISGVTVAAVAGIDRSLAIGLVALGLSVISQVGDFSESALKRRFGAKDASHLIPGHGGLMDRLDGFWAAAVAATVLGLWRGGVAAPAHGLMIW